MDKYASGSKAWMWFMASLVAGLMAGCGGGSSSGSASQGAGPAAVAPGAAGTSGAAATDPTVGSSYPSNSATNVPTSTNSRNNVVTGTALTATFTQPMDPATLNSAPAGTLLTFTLKETIAGTNVPGTVAMNAANTMATFTPTAAALNANTGYTATVTTAAKNAAGTAMPNPVAWSFTTRAAAFTGQAPVDLGLAGNYAIFADTGISTVPASVITGDIGVGPGVTSTAITGFAPTLPAGSAFSTSAQVTGKIYAFDYAAPTPTNVTTASNDMNTAYLDAAGRLLPDFLNFNGGNLSGQTLTPGLYSWTTAVDLLAGNVTISGGPGDVWIFQMSGDLTLGASTNMNLSGGAKAKNIFWQVAGGAGVILGTSAHLEGIVLTDTGINFGNAASANGRLLAATDVNLNQNAVTQPAP